MVFGKRPPSLEDEMEHEYDPAIDPELRLRTVRTAHSAIIESIETERRAERRKTTRRRFFRSKSDKKKDEPAPEVSTTPSTHVPGERRNIYLNAPLSAAEVDKHGEPTARYVRNKVRTTKYTVITFIPKNLYEQFGRVANVYFLALVILQVFPIFGAAAPQIAMLPLLFITIVTALKDGVEDYRRATLDEEVNVSAATKLCQWRNVNQPQDPRSFIEKLLRMNAPGSISKGVRKLREKEASEGMRRVVLSKTGDADRTSLASTATHDGRRLDDIQSVDSHSYPPSGSGALGTSPGEMGGWGQFGSTLRGGMEGYQQSLRSQAPSSTGVVDWSKRVSGGGRWERTLWKKLEVGDVVLLRDNEQVPADIVVLSTSDPDGMCYLETKNLDGETNLKARKALKASSTITSEEDVERSSFVLDSEPPHQNLYLYHGVLRYTDPNTKEVKQDTVTINELLLRGCAIRNTQWIIGLVVFTGPDTKIMLNGGDTPSKRSKIEKETNFNVIVNFIVLLVMCAIGAVFSGLNDSRNDTSADFFEQGSEPTDYAVLNGLVTFVSCLIAFQNIVPISLYISIEIVKTIQAYFISQDIDMYYEPYDTPCVPKTWNISDDLGQIEYVFSDKTGTLTQNIMEFQKCSVNGIAYGEGVTEAQRGAATREGKTMMDPDELNEKLAKLKQDMTSKMERSFKNRYAQLDKLTLVSPKLADNLGDRNSPERDHLMAFFKALALCHTVLADRPEPQKEPYHLEYKAESPDEAALVAAARDAGFPFVGKTKDTFDIEVMGNPERYTLLKMLEFNSTRKRMTVIMRCSDGRIVLYCKGADSVIYERLAKDHDENLRVQTSKDMEAFANSGLRTLCIAHRYLTEDEYMQWSRTYDTATSAVKDRDEEIEKANALMEHSLYILGATALEDKLQEGVPEAIEMLHRAGIKLWILTGDKLQTAIEIGESLTLSPRLHPIYPRFPGFSCNLLKSDMDLMILSADTVEATRSQIEAGLNKIASVLGPPSWDPRKRGFMPGAKASFAVVIDGDTLRHALTDELKPLFLNLGTQCETVVCCRVSPAQKALTVKLVKEGRNAMTLSIGDGANDVAMIQEANIGCGLFGLEGSQAAMSADYAFGQFRFLTKLLLIHGRWSYQRIADMHSNFFYKNMIWTFAMFWYLPFNSFDATYLYQYTFILLFNLVFTSLPVIALGAFDQDINAKAALAYPQLYVRGIRGLEYTRAKFWMYMLDGFYQSAVVFFIPYAVWQVGLAVSWNGKGIDSLADFGTTVSVAAIFAANLYVGINTHYWTVMTWVVVFGSSIVMLLWIVVYSFFQSSDFIDEVVVLFGELTFWTVVVFSVFFALMPRFLIKFMTNVYSPLDKDIVREMWVKGNLKDELGVGHRRDKNKHLEVDERGNMEAAPMFREPHARSESEFGDTAYQPAMTRSPGDVDLITGYPDTPEPKRNSARNSGAQYLYAPSPIPGNASSPHPSYYSASDIPPPSPQASPVYQDMLTGQQTSIAPSRRGSLKSMASRNTAAAPSSPAPMPSPYSPGLQPGSPNRAGMSPTSPGFEMRVRSPPTSPLPDRRDLSRASEASYATAIDQWPDDGRRGQNHSQGYTVDKGHQPHGAAGGDARQSWQGGRAL